MDWNNTNYRVRMRLERVSEPGDDWPIIDCPEVGAEIFRSLGDEHREHFVVAMTDHKHRLTGTYLHSIGTKGKTLVDPGDVFRAALLADSAGIIVVHNHPSGDTNFSRDDICLTERLIKAGEMIGVDMLDHFLVAGDHCISLRNQRPELWH